MTRPPLSPPLLANRPMVVVSLHLPDLAVARQTSMATLEEYVLTNAAVFSEAGIPAIMLQDMTRVPGAAAPDSTAIMAALGRLIREKFPHIALGIIFRAHDARAPLAVAHAVGASFVRIKVYVGGVMSAAGPLDGLGTEARAYRHDLRRDDIAILADVHDRTSVPRSLEADEQAAQWAVQLGADALIVTGATFAESLARVKATRAAGVRAPVLIGGSVTAENVFEALDLFDGVIVSTSLMRKAREPDDPLRWDVGRAKQLMERIHEWKARHP
jgi:predicted TIM-barrel enzyme